MTSIEIYMPKKAEFRIKRKPKIVICYLIPLNGSIMKEKLSGFVAKLVKTFTIRKNDSLYQEENGT